MRVAITGATGNLGTSVIRTLQDDEKVDEIIGIARRRPEIELPKVQWRAADVVTAPLASLFEDVDVVIHLAWRIQPSHDLALLESTNVNGSRRVFKAAAAAGVSTIVHASSVGAYSPGPKDRTVSESWPTEGIPTSSYSRQKAEVERILDGFEAKYPQMRCVRIRPALIFKRESAAEIHRLFLGKLVPTVLPRPVPLIPNMANFTIQSVHADDVARAIRETMHRDVRGAFNLAADPPLDPAILAMTARAMRVPMTDRIARKMVDTAWHLRLQPTEAGWVDLALQVPLMSIERATRKLDWTPAIKSTEAFAELIEGMGSNHGFPTPPMQAGRRPMQHLGQRVVRCVRAAARRRPPPRATRPA